MSTRGNQTEGDLLPDLSTGPGGDDHDTRPLSCRRNSTDLPEIELFLGRHDTPSSGMWVYSRNLLLGFLELGISPSVIAGGGREIHSELLRILPSDKVRFLKAGTWRRRIAVIGDLALSKTKGEIVHGTSNLVPLTRCKRRVITLHDLLQGFPPEKPTGLYQRIRQALYRIIYKILTSSADLIVTDKEETADLIQRTLSPICPVEVIEPPLDSAFLKAPLPALADSGDIQNGVKKILLFASSDPRKNVKRVFQALSKINTECEITAVVNSSSARQMVEESSAIADVSVSIVEGVPAAEMPSLYSSHQLLVFPSLAEGFGYPAYEALSQGSAVVVSEGMIKRSLLSEISPLVFECDPGQVESIVRCMEAAVSCEVENAVRRRIASIIRTFLAPGRAAQRLLELYKEPVKGA